MASKKKAPPARKAPPRKRGASTKSKRDGGRRAAIALREAIGAAFVQDRQVTREAAGRVSGGKPRSPARPHIANAAGALEPVLAQAVRERPSFLGRVAYGTAQLLSALASEDHASSRRLTEIARGTHVGIVFVDVVGFTAFTSANGDEAAVDLVKRLETLVATVCRKHEGEVVKHLGDGFFLAFPSASQAVRGALALRDAVRKVRERDAAFPLLRIAVHAGTPSVVQDDLIGHDVNLTARMLEHCDPGDVLVTEEAKRLAERRLRSVRFSKAGRARARGVPDPVVTYRADAT